MGTFLAYRTVVLSTLLACCGGQAASDAAKSPETVNAASPAQTSGTPGDPDGATTTTALGDGGELVGERLAEAHSGSSTGASPERGPTTPHRHEPGRGAEDIRAIVVAHRDEARACYDRGLRDHPGIEGDLVIQWTIDPKGNVTQVAPDSTRSQVTEAVVITCVGELIKRIQFSPSPGGFETRAFYPFNFHPHHRQ
jgi:hypothetical protein